MTISMKNNKPCLNFVVYATTVLIFNEYVIYYLLLFFCKQPELETLTTSQHQDPLRLLVLADPHLLGERLGNWFDKLRREWQIYRSFRTAVELFNPDAIFILGDLLDEGSFANNQQWSRYVNRAKEIFDLPNRQTYVVVGNHDVGFHNSITKYKIKRFQKAFKTKNVEATVLKGNIIAMLNSMGLDDDQCFMCNDVAARMHQLSKSFNCSEMIKQNTTECGKLLKFPNVKPVLFQHFPLFRDSDASCNEVDAISKYEAYPFQPKHHCVSKEASKKVLEMLKPRLIVSGHTHSGCKYYHDDILEISVPSFSWRNRPNPSFLLITITPEDFAVSKCFLPNEYVVIAIYVVFLLNVLVYPYIKIPMFSYISSIGRCIYSKIFTRRKSFV